MKIKKLRGIREEEMVREVEVRKGKWRNISLYHSSTGAL